MTFADEMRPLLEQYGAKLVDHILVTRLVMRAAVLLRQNMDAALAEQYIDMRGYLALSVISLHKGQALRPSDLSLSLAATRTQVTRLLDVLSKDGLVTRLHSQLDRRALILELTEMGEKKLARCIPIIHEVYRQAWVDVPDLDSVQTALSALNQRLQIIAKADEVEFAQEPKL